MTRRPPTIAYTRGRTVRVWGDGALRLAELLNVPYTYGGITVPLERLSDVRAAAQHERIPLVERTHAA